MRIGTVVSCKKCFLGIVVLGTLLSLEVQGAMLDVIYTSSIGGGMPVKGTKYGVAGDGTIVGVSVLDGSYTVLGNDGRVERTGKIDVSNMLPVTGGTQYQAPVVSDFSVDGNGDIYFVAAWRPTKQTVQHGIAVFDKKGAFVRSIDVKGLRIGSMSLGKDRMYIKGVTYEKAIENRVHEFDKMGNELGGFFPFPDASSWRDRSVESLQSVIAASRARGDFVDLSRKDRSSNNVVRGHKNGASGGTVKEFEKEIIHQVKLPPDKGMVGQFGLPVGTAESTYKAVMLTDGTTVAQIMRTEYYVDPSKKERVGKTHLYVDVLQQDGQVADRISTDEIGVLAGVDATDKLYFIGKESTTGSQSQSLRLVKAILK